MSTFIFDFDGTLADTFPVVVDVVYEISGVPRKSEKEITELRGLPLLSAVRALGTRVWQLPLLILRARRLMLPRMRGVEAFPGVADALKELHDSGHKLFILTSNRGQNADVFLRAHHLRHYFDDIVSVYYGNVFYKVYGLRKLLTRNHLDAKDCYYVGNEALDLRAAAHVGVRGVATTWAGHNRERLAEASPFTIIDQPKELLKIAHE
ncbi:MAG TPA: HAD hydrolase-like protein [Candidatus Saccharimonadales bacterium]